MTARIGIVVWALFDLWALSGTARAQTYTVKGDGRSHARFEAHTSTEEFTGRTDRVEGTVTVAPADGSAGARVEARVEARVTVDLASLDSGVPLRDRHMRDRYLQTSRYPKAVFTLRRVVSPVPLVVTPDRPTPVRLEGTLQIHGIERPLAAEATVTRLTRETIGGRSFLLEAVRAHAEFSVRLRDFGIATPRFLFFRMSQTQKVVVDLYAEAPRRK